MLQPRFIEGLRWLGEQGYSFDLGVDQRSGGLWQLDEAIEMVHRAHNGLPEDKKVTVVISTAPASVLYYHKLNGANRSYVQTGHAEPP